VSILAPQKGRQPYPSQLLMGTQTACQLRPPPVPSSAGSHRGFLIDVGEPAAKCSPAYSPQRAQRARRGKRRRGWGKEGPAVCRPWFSTRADQMPSSASLSALSAPSAVNKPAKKQPRSATVPEIPELPRTAVAQTPAARMRHRLTDAERSR